MRFLALDTKDLREKYEKHMESIADAYPKKLYKIFCETNRFHDYSLAKMSYIGDEVMFKKQHNKVVISMFSDIVDAEDYLTIEFDEIVHFSFDTDHYCKYGDFFLKEIYYAELDVCEDNSFSFEFIVSDGPRFYVQFKKCRILERKKPRYLG